MSVLNSKNCISFLILCLSSFIWGGFYFFNFKAVIFVLVV